MATSEMNDLFMWVLADDGRIKGESSMKKADDDKFMTDFVSAEYDSYANFFDVTSFQLALKLGDQDQSAGGGTGASGGTSATGLGISHSDWFLFPDPLKKFTDDNGQQLYKLDQISGSFGKVLDSVSPIFFQKCCEKKALKEAILVKRAFTGKKVLNEESQAYGYLKIRMTDVRIMSVAWTDGDFVDEKINFKCGHMEIHYKQQSDSGILGSPQTLLNWTWDKKKG